MLVEIIVNNKCACDRASVIDSGRNRHYTEKKFLGRRDLTDNVFVFFRYSDVLAI